ncbi:hypothetical protein [Streptomyces hirsutus]
MGHTTWWDTPPGGTHDQVGHTTWRGAQTVGVTHRTTRADLRFSGR